MRSASKQRISGIILLVCALCMVVCIARMLPYGMSGEIGKVKVYFAVMAVAFILSLPSGIAYNYYRSDVQAQDEDKKLERMRIETNMLSYVGQKSPKVDPLRPSHNEQNRDGHEIRP